MIRSGCFLLLALLLAGCPIGGLRPGEPSFNARSVRHVKTVAATTSWWSVLCFVPLSFTPHYKTTMKKLHAKASLRHNEALVNLRVDKQPIFMLLACFHKLTISADIVALNSAATGSNANEQAEQKPEQSGGAAASPEPLRSPCQTRCEKGFSECNKQCTPEQPACARYCEHNRNRCMLRCR